MSIAAIKGIPHDSIYLEFPEGKSDGDENKWPTDKLDPTPNDNNEVNFMRPIAHDEPLCIKWRMQAGREVAKLMGLADHAKYVLKDFPKGYKFYHHNKGSAYDPRTDPYLYGSPSGKYRSPQEFIPHAFWLITDDTLNRKNCVCKYCSSHKSQKQVRQEIGLKPIGSITGSTHVKPKIRTVIQPRKPGPQSRSNVNHDRTADLRSSRRFRIGELVWCALSPAIQGAEQDECIEFWPGLVSETRLKSEPTPHAPGEQWRVIQSNVYKVKLLAVMHSYVLPESAILPYQAYCPSVNLIEPLRRAGDPSLLQDLQQLSQFNPIFLGAEPAGSSQLRFVEASTPFALAIQIAAHLVRLWTPSDEWTFHGESPLSPSATQSSNGPATVNITEARHQGLWWGAERMWVDELVRLQPGRSQVVPQGSPAIYRASPRADGRGVLLRINSIFAQPKGLSKDSTRDCKVAGVLYELAEETYEEATPNVAPSEAQPGTPTISLVPMLRDGTVIPTDTIPFSENGVGLGSSSSSQIPKTQHPPSPPHSPSNPINIPSFPAYPLPNPPSGYRFRQITKPGYEIILDVSLIAGRYYPDLLKHPLLQDALADVDMNESRVTQLGALCGLLAGAINSMECMDWVGTRLSMIQQADVKAQQDLYRHWHASHPAKIKEEDVMDISNDHMERQDVDMEARA